MYNYRHWAPIRAGRMPGAIEFSQPARMLGYEFVPYMRVIVLEEGMIVLFPAPVYRRTISFDSPPSTDQNLVQPERRCTNRPARSPTFARLFSDLTDFGSSPDVIAGRSRNCVTEC